jgi:hypothetical protein
MHLIDLLHSAMARYDCKSDKDSPDQHLTPTDGDASTRTCDAVVQSVINRLIGKLSNFFMSSIQIPDDGV